MVNGKRLLVVVPARGGSKGIPLKNIQLLGGRPLLEYTADIIHSLEDVDKAVVSTDNKKIATVAMECGLDVPFERPAELSGDRIGDWDVLHHALTTMESLDLCKYDVVIMLQPTSPLRKKVHVVETYRKLIDEKYDSVWTLSPTDIKAHPLKQLTIKDGCMEYFDGRGAHIIARQQLESVYHRNGVAYAFTRDCILNQQSIKGKRSSAVIIEDPVANIDTYDDLQMASQLLERN